MLLSHLFQSNVRYVAHEENKYIQMFCLECGHLLAFQLTGPNSTANSIMASFQQQQQQQQRPAASQQGEQC